MVKKKNEKKMRKSGKEYSLRARDWEKTNLKKVTDKWVKE